MRKDIKFLLDFPPTQTILSYKRPNIFRIVITTVITFICPSVFVICYYKLRYKKSVEYLFSVSISTSQLLKSSKWEMKNIQSIVIILFQMKFGSIRFESKFIKKKCICLLVQVHQRGILLQFYVCVGRSPSFSCICTRQSSIKFNDMNVINVIMMVIHSGWFRWSKVCVGKSHKAWTTGRMFFPWV